MADIKLSALKPTDKNPRKIKDKRFELLKTSIQEFPKMMELRPIIYDEKNRVLAGHQKLLALKDLGYESIPRTWVKKASELSQEEKDRFMLMDNEHFGEYDYDILKTNWNVDLAAKWGLELKTPEEKEPVSFAASKVPKGTRVLVTCPDKAKANDIYARLLSEGLEVKIK